MPTVKGITDTIRNMSEKIADTGSKLQRRYKRYADNAPESDIGFPDEVIIETVTEIPQAKIDRNTSLSEQFQAEEESRLKTILEKGPVEAGCDREELRKKAISLTQKRITQTFIGDIPEAILEKTAIPYNTLLYYMAAVRLIQEIAYLYGESDFWNSADCDTDKTVSRLYLYYSVMSGSGKAEKALKLLSSSVTSKSFNKLTENFIEKTVYQPIIKPAAKALKIKKPKTMFNKVISKAMPVVKNAVSGGINLSSLYPMAGRLIKTLDEAQFSYSAADFEKDWYEISKDDEASEKQALTEINPNAEA